MCFRYLLCVVKPVQHGAPHIISLRQQNNNIAVRKAGESDLEEGPLRALMRCQPPLAWTSVTSEKCFLPSRRRGDRCVLTRTNTARPPQRLCSPFVSVDCRYEVWQGSDGVLSPASHQKQTRGAGLICWMFSSPAVCSEGGEVMKGLTVGNITFTALVCHLSRMGTNRP